MNIRKSTTVGVTLLLALAGLSLLPLFTASLSGMSGRCLDICRRTEEALCKRCLFREPMRFGKRAGALREPMRFGKKSTGPGGQSWGEKREAFREPMRFGKKSTDGALRGKRAEASFREPMRFGKRENEIAGPIIDDYLLVPEAPLVAWGEITQLEPSTANLASIGASEEVSNGSNASVD